MSVPSMTSMTSMGSGMSMISIIPIGSAISMTPMYNYSLYSMYQQPFFYQVPIYQETSQQTVVPSLSSTSTRKKGESLAHSIRKLEDGRPYPTDYSTNSLK